jgi:hypothetical protein
MEKKGLIYYEKSYEKLLEDYLKAKTNEDKKEALKKISDFLATGKAITGNVDTKTLDTEEYFNYRNSINYKRVAENATFDEEHFNKCNFKDQYVKDEIKASKKRRTLRHLDNTLKGVVAAGAIVAVLACAKSCSNKKANNGSDITTTTTTTEATTDNTVATTTTPSESTSATTTYDTDGAVPSMSKEMDGIKINEPTETTRSNGGNNGGSSNNGGSNNGGSNNGGSNNGGSNSGNNGSPSQTEGTTKPAETSATTSTTTTTTSETTTDPSVPTTEPVETKNTAPADESHQRDITVDVHDGENPKYIEEDPTQTYPTYINIPETSKTTEATTTTTAKPTTTTTAKPTTGTVNGMPVEEDPNETYETYFNAGQKTKSKDKTLTLRK